MKLKMLVSYAGTDFSLSPGDVTDRFSDAEAKRLIKEGHAEKAPPAVLKKPASKAEWDDERDTMLAERDGMAAQLAEANERVSALSAQLSAFTAFKAGLASAMADLSQETAEAPPAAETRG